ncbi:MAG: WD40 repeat domain-containing protein [Pirellulaceae bacterium]
MQRRFFLMSCAATGFSAFLPRLARANANPNSDWYSHALQTPARPPKFRSPVVTGVDITPDERYLAVVGDDHFVSIYDLQSEDFSHILPGHSDWIRVARFTPDGTKLVTAGNDRKAIMRTVGDWERPVQFGAQSAAIIDSAFTPDSQTIAFVGFDDALRTYNLDTQETINELKCPCEDMRSVAYNSDGSLLAAGGRSGEIRIWDTLTGRDLIDISAHRQRIRSIQFTTDGRIVSCSEDQFVRVFDSKTGQLLIELPRFAAKLFAIQLLSDELIATSGSDNKISLWNLGTQKRVDVLEGHTGTVSCLSSNGTTLISGSYDTQIRIWRRSSEVGVIGRQTQNDDGWNMRLK